jgi:hypothetical protein
MDEREFEERVARRIDQQSRGLGRFAPLRPQLGALIAHGEAPRVSARVRTPIGSIGLLALAGAIVLALGLASVNRPGPVATGRQTATPAASTTAVLSTRTSTASPVPNSTPVTTPPSGFKVLGSGSVVWADWAPDGRHLAINFESQTSGAASSVGIFDRGGAKLTTIDGAIFAWTGSDTYLLRRFDLDGTEHDSVGRLGSATEQPVKTGSVVAAPQWPSLPCVATDSNGAYDAWFGGKDAGPRDGHAMACSPDLTRIAVIVVGDGEGTCGWLKVVRADTGATVREFRSVQLCSASAVVFSADGSKVFVGDVASILDVQTGRVVVLPGFAPYGAPSGIWLPDGRVAVADENGRVQAFGVDGVESPADLPQGRYLSISSTGVIVAIPDGAATTIEIESGGVRRTIDLAAPALPYPAWSADGRALVVVCGTETPVPASSPFDKPGSIHGEEAVLIEVP